MHRPANVMLDLGVAMLTILTLVLTACGGGNPAQEKKASEVHHIPEDSQVYEGEPLPVGRYVTEKFIFKSTMSFDLGKGWTRDGTELRDDHTETTG